MRYLLFTPDVNRLTTEQKLVKALLDTEIAHASELNLADPNPDRVAALENRHEAILQRLSGEEPEIQPPVPPTATDIIDEPKSFFERLISG